MRDTIERSVMPTSSMLLQTSSILTTPFSSLSCTRKTAAWFCITCCRLPRISAVERGPVEWRSLSRLSMENSPALAGSGFCGADGLVMSLIRLAQARPKTTMSSRLSGQGRRFRAGCWVKGVGSGCVLISRSTVQCE